MTQRHTQILADLISFPSVCRTPNGEIIDYVRTFLRSHGVEATVMAGPEGDRFNLFATIGPKVAGGIILSAHLDVVPAPVDGWLADPFRMRAKGDVLIGRGAVDMKGFAACMLASVPTLVKAPLRRPVHLSLSYDEEVGSDGVRHLIAQLPKLCPPPAGCIVGEPSGMRPVLRHKGKVAQRVIAHGKAGHSSRTDLGDNAIHYAAALVARVHEESLRLVSEGPFDASFQPPYSTLQVGVIQGGSSINVIPAECAFEIEVRAIPGQEPGDVLTFVALEAERIAQAARLTGHDVTFAFETTIDYPPLALPEDDPLAALAEVISGRKRQAAVSYGTEAGRFQRAGVPSIVCGPGDVNRAHKPEEFILGSELAEAMTMIGRLAEHLCD